MDPKSRFCSTLRSRGNVGVVLIVKTDELCEGYTKYHEILSTNARERVILRFRATPCLHVLCSFRYNVSVVDLSVQEALTVQAYSVLCESFPAATWLTVSRGPEVQPTPGPRLSRGDSKTDSSRTFRRTQ